MLNQTVLSCWLKMINGSCNHTWPSRGGQKTTHHAMTFKNGSSGAGVLLGIMWYVAWWSSLGTLSWYPTILVKSLQLIWRSGTRSSNELQWLDIRIVVLVTSTRTHCSKLSQKSCQSSCLESQIINIKLKKILKKSSWSSSKVVCFGQADCQ